MYIKHKYLIKVWKGFISGKIGSGNNVISAQGLLIICYIVMLLTIGSLV